MTGVTAVIPTYRRREAALASVPNHLALTGVHELLYVDDGSPDGTADALEALGHPRVRVVRHAQNRGLPAARNTGAAGATTEWVVFLEDDCGFPDDYVERLLEVAVSHGADIVGAPWLHTSSNAAARRAPAHPVATMGLLSPPWAHPTAPLETPFMPALALVRRAVFDTLQFDTAYAGNFYREETDFFLSARRAGRRVVLTPTTASWQLGSYSGGCKVGTQLFYDRYVVRNTRLLLRKHGSWMQREGLLPGRQWVTLLAVVAPLLPFYLKAPLRAARRLLRRLTGTA